MVYPRNYSKKLFDFSFVINIPTAEKALSALMEVFIFFILDQIRLLSSKIFGFNLPIYR
jgi:hypothetical protein